MSSNYYYNSIFCLNCLRKRESGIKNSYYFLEVGRRYGFDKKICNKRWRSICYDLVPRFPNLTLIPDPEGGENHIIENSSEEAKANFPCLKNAVFRLDVFNNNYIALCEGCWCRHGLPVDLPWSSTGQITLFTGVIGDYLQPELPV